MFRTPTDLAPRRLTRERRSTMQRTAVAPNVTRNPPRSSRRTIRTWVSGAAVVAAVLLASPPPLVAQTYPSRTITIVVPFAAGGPTDVLARTLAERMEVSLGQPV